MELGERANEREPDAEPSLRTVERAVPLGEQLEHLREQSREDSDAVVPDPKDRLVPFDSGDELDASPDGRVFGGVREEVDEDLLKPGGVGLELQVG